MERMIYLKEWDSHRRAMEVEIADGLGSTISGPRAFELSLHGFCHFSGGRLFLLYAMEGKLNLQVGRKIWRLGSSQLRMTLRRRLFNPRMRRFSVRASTRRRLVHDYPSELMPWLRDPTFDLIDAEGDFFLFLVRHYRSKEWLQRVAKLWSAGFRMSGD